MWDGYGGWVFNLLIIDIMIYVLWHTNPDTDAILSAMIYAKYLQLWWVDATPVRLWSMNNETIHALDVLWWDAPELVDSLPAGTQVALTDHNEITQSISNITELEVVAIIDHHKFNFQTSQPIDILVRPIASTCSVIYGLWKARWSEISMDVAKAMMMGIVSDTLYFRSPTTTDYDRQIFDELNQIAGIENTEQFSLDMFAAKSDLGDIAVRDLITLDYKVFESGGKRFGIGTIETTNPSYTLNRKDEILDDLTNLKQEQSLDMVMLCVVDILNEHNITIYPHDADSVIIKSVFGVDGVDNIADLGDRISRKKQLAWPMTDYFA